MLADQDAVPRPVLLREAFTVAPPLPCHSYPPPAFLGPPGLISSEMHLFFLFNSQLVFCSQVAQTLEGSTVFPRQFLTQPQTEERVHPFRFRSSWRNKAVGKTHALACLEPDVPQM